MAKLLGPLPEFPSERGVTVLGNDPPPGMQSQSLAKQDQRDLDEQEILTQAREFLEYASSEESDNRNRAAEMLRFCYKRQAQWPDKVRKSRENEDRPCLEVNQMPAFVNQVLNDIRQNRPSIKVRGASDDATAEMAEIRQDLIRHIEYKSNAAQAYDNGVRYAVVANIGYWRITTQYESETSFNQEICIEPVPNPFSVYYDPDCRQPDGSDAKQVLICEDLRKEEFYRRYPDASPIDFQTSDPAISAWLKDDTIRVADYLHKVNFKEDLYQFPDGSTAFESDLEEVPAEGEYVQKREVDRCRVEWHVLNGVEILETHEWAGKYIPVVPVYGDVTNIEGEVIRQALVERAMDSQQMYNYLVTNAAEGAGLQPKSPFIVAEGQIDQREREWGQANNSNLPYLTYRRYGEDGKDLGVPQRSSPDVDVTGLLNQAALFRQDMRNAIGIADPLQQMQIEDQSGRALLAKERIGATGSYHFVDNLTRAIRYTGLVLLDLIPHIFDTQRTIQLLREDGTDYKATVNQQQPAPAPVLDMHGNAIPQNLPPPPLLNDLSVGDYDVVVDVGPSFASKRAEFANMVMELTQANPALWQIAGDLLVKNMDWPNAEMVADRLQVMLPPQIQQLIAQKSQDPQVAAMGAAIQQMQTGFQQQMQQLTQNMQKLQQDNQSLQSQVYVGKAALAKSGVDLAQAKSAMRQKDIEAMADLHTQILESQDVQARIADDGRKREAERFKILQEALSKREEADIERQKLNIDAFTAITNVIAKLGPQVGAQGAEVAARELPMAEKAIEQPDFSGMFQAMAAPIQAMTAHSAASHAQMRDIVQRMADHSAATNDALTNLAMERNKPRRHRIYKDESGAMVGESVPYDEGGVQ